MGEQQAEGKPVAPCQNKCLHSDHCPQGGSELGLNGVGNLYLPTSSLSICFSVLETFLSRHTCITPSTYVYTPFASDLVLAKSVAVGKTPRQTSLFDRLGYWPHIAWARCHHYEIESTLRKNRVHHFRSVT